MERPDPVKEAIRKVTEGQHLDRHEARQVMDAIMEGRATHAQIGSLVTALKMKGETVDEITGFAESMRGKCRRVETERSGLLDTCGTGGDGARTFNISTAAAIVAAAGGVRTAKHGNRAMSSKSGSADVLEALGVNIQLTPEQAAACLEKVGICFMFAQLYHPALRHAAAPRREMGVRTIFNMLGPLTNPAGADRQFIGLYDRSRTEAIARVLQRLGVKRAMVVGGHDGLDEISISAPTRVTELKDGEIRTYEVTPESLGLSRAPIERVFGGDAAENAAIARRVLSGETGPHRDIVLANAGACIYVSGRAESLADGVRVAAETIDSGKAMAKLDEWIATAGALSHVS